MTRFLSAVAAIALSLAALCAPAAASINPTYTLFYQGSGLPGQGSIVTGIITLGASDTYTTGGFNVTPAALGFSVDVSSLVANSPQASLELNISTPVNSANATVKFVVAMSGASNMTAAATTKSVTIPTGFTANDVLTANTQIIAVLDDAAIAGGGTGTWAVTDTVASVKETSTSAFTVTAIAAAPTNNGNFVWEIPALNMEMPAATPIAGLVIPFHATCA